MRRAPRFPRAESRLEVRGVPRNVSRRGRGLAGSDRGEITRRIAAAARGDFDVLTHAELRECGLSDSGIQKRVQAGLLFPRYPGVYAVGRPDLSVRGQRMAAIKACGPGACLSFASAAVHRGMWHSRSASTDVTVPPGRPLLRLRGIRCHRADLAPQDFSLVEGIPCTSVSRTLLDLSIRFGDLSIESAANEAVNLEIFDLREMEDLLGRSRGRRGVRRLRRVLENGDISGENRPKSGLERRYAELCAKHGLPRPAINRWILLGDEYHEVDFLWRKQRVVIEVDSRRYHRSGWKLARDEKRDDLLPEHGYLHARVHEDLIDASPFEAVQEAARRLEARGWRRR